jgi:predicted transposase YdaD
MGLLRAILPSALTERLCWDSLTREPVSFVDARLRWLHGDLLFSARLLGTDEEVLIYLLVEHQSTPHPLMAFRVLRYVTRVWDDYLRKRRWRTRLERE